MPRILDNIDEHLLPTLNETLADSKCLDACVGYFNLRGWDALCDEVDGLDGTNDRPPVRLLIGMQDRPDSRLRQELSIIRKAAKRDELRMDNATADSLRREAASQLREQLTWGIPTDRDERTLRTLRQQLSDGEVQVKLHLKHRLHAKLYLCHTDSPISPMCGFVGSSNLTLAGLSTQGELNVDVLDHDATKKLEIWFEDRWNEDFSIDITAELIEIIDESWASEKILDPYLIHLRIAYHLSRDAREGLIEYGLPDSMKDRLLEYQSAAVKITARNLMSRGGAMLGDVVGLGKTIVATAAALLLQEDYGYETLVVCPKNLVPMWQGYLDTFRLHGKVVSLSMVHKDLENLRRYRLVVVDESHNLRNPKGRAYQALRKYISENDPKVLLLTATPYNTSMKDVVGQLGLFIDEDHDLGVRPEAAIAELGDVEFLAKCDDKPSTLRAFSLSEHPVDWQRLLAQFLIRRTRQFINDNYAVFDEDNGRHYLVFGDESRHYLPKRIPKPLPFETTANDPASDMASDEVIGALDSLRLPRYDLSKYVVDSELNLTPAEEEAVKQVQTGGGNLLGFTRTMLMKRLSSSGAVFALSLQRHLLRNCMYAQAVSVGEVLPIGAVDDTQLFESDSDEILEIPVDENGVDTEIQPRAREQWADLATNAFDYLKRRDPNSVTWVRSELFNEELLEDLEHDIDVISMLLNRFGTWSASTDSKLDALEELLTETHKDEKVLIFSEYADSARYVADALKRRGISKIEAVTGDNESPVTLARRFSPRSNNDVFGVQIEAEVGDELRVLVATDVLSEGQNLQDAAIVVNWDLPWAIVKLIQRAGRVDRIGQDSEEVIIYTFLPTGGVEEVLRLRRRVADRLAQNASVFGSDERFLNTADEVKLIKGIFAEGGSDTDSDNLEQVDSEQVDYASAAYEIWRSAEADDPNLAKAAKTLPDMVHATRLADGETGALVYTLSQHDVDRIGFVPFNGPPRRLSPLEALRLSACEPNTPGLEHMADHFKLVKSAVEGPLSPDEFDTEGALSGIRLRVYNRIQKSLNDSGNQLPIQDAEFREAVDAIHRSPLTEQAKQAFAKALREPNPAELGNLAVTLWKDNRLIVDPSLDPDAVRIVCSMGFSPGADTTKGGR